MTADAALDEKPFAEMTYQDWREVMNVILDGTFHCVKACLPHLKASGAGTIVNIGSFFDKLPAWTTNGLGLNFYFGGTSLLIVVGVAMDTANQIESQLIMRHYEGFSPKSGRIKGRRSW